MAQGIDPEFKIQYWGKKKKKERKKKTYKKKIKYCHHFTPEETGVTHSRYSGKENVS
jgi:hypothetical protein